MLIIIGSSNMLDLHLVDLVSTSKFGRGKGGGGGGI